MGVAPRVGILGGTFDPVHNAHLVVAEAAREALGLTQVVLVPAGQPWLKGHEPAAAAGHRVSMLTLAVGYRASLSLSLVEVERAGPSYTVDTLATLLQLLGARAELVLILGLDAALELPRWHEPEQVLEQARLAVVPRPGRDVRELDALTRTLPQAAGRIDLVDAPLLEISSTDVRERLATGRTVRQLVPEGVEAYLRWHGLYGCREAGKARAS